MSFRSVCLLFLLFSGMGISEEQGYGSQVKLITENRYKTFFRLVRSGVVQVSKKRAWKRAAPGVKEVLIRSSFDSTDQHALFYNSGSAHKKPLLVALHSWSEDYLSRLSIPFGIWALKNDWVMIHPDYRGPFTGPSSTLSEGAVQDILDAVAYAKRSAHVDETRIYVCGFSGGGMATLVMVGRYPQIWTAASAWVPVYDLAEWYTTTKHATHNYSRHITNSCGGAPLPGTDAEKECRKRSVSTYLSNAKGKNIPVYIASGIKDRFVPPGHSLKAFNDLADAGDTISGEDIVYVNKRHKIPKHLSGSFRDALFLDVGLKVIFSKTSSNVTLKIFDGDHDIIFNAGLFWLSQQKKQ